MAEPPRPRRLSLGKKLLFSALVALVFVAGAEALVRGWVYYLREEFERYDAATETFVLVPGEHRGFGRTVRINSEGFVGPELEPGGDDLWRIVALGDSNTFGGGNEIHTFPAKLDGLLEARERDGRRYEVVNAGIEGMDSTNALRRLRSKVLPLSPDVVMIYIGWNDLMKFDPLGQEGGSALAAASRGLDQLWLVKGIRKLVFLQLRPYLDPPATGPESRTGRFTDFRPEAYVANLRTMIDEVRAAGARPVLMTLATVVQEDTGLDDIRRGNIYFPYYPSAYGVGDLLDLVAAYNRAIVAVAGELDVPVARLDRVLGDPPDSGALFYDTMHPTDRGQMLVAEALLELLDGETLLGASGSSAFALP